MAAELPTGGVIYGIRFQSEFVYRYVGLTTKSVETRGRQHVKVARSGRKTPFYDWLRVHDRDEIVVDVLDQVEGLEDLGRAEIGWIEWLRREGHPLLNLSQGGLGPMGIEWTAEMREAARIRSTGRKGVSRFADENPFYGRTHAAEQRAKWSSTRKGQNAGPENPNYRKFGEDHPSFGHVMSEQARKGYPNRGWASAIRIMGGRRATSPAQRCRQCVRAGQCRQVDVARTPATIQIGELGKTRADTASKSRVEPGHASNAISAFRSCI